MRGVVLGSLLSAIGAAMMALLVAYRQKLEKRKENIRQKELSNTNIIPYDDFLVRFRNLSKTLKETRGKNQ